MSFTTRSRSIRLLGPGLLLVLISMTAVEAKKPGGGGGNGGGGSGPSYTIVKLDDGGGAFVAGPVDAASDINDLGNVVGTVQDVASGIDVPVFWEVDGTDSSIIPLAASGFAYGVNNFNEIVGLDSGQALYWPSPADPPLELPPLVDDLATVAYAINDDGVICGFARDLVFNNEGIPIASTDVAVVWRVTHPDGVVNIAGPVPLPTWDDRSQAYGLDESDANGQVNIVGVFMAANFARTAAVQWTVQLHVDGTLSVDPVPVALETGDAAAYGVNDLGVSCGDSANASSSPDARVWFDGSGLTLDADGRAWTSARGVNDAGVIVGAGGTGPSSAAALVWPSRTARPILLAKFLPKRNAPFLGLWSATAVNASGMIAGEGGDGVTSYAFVAIPK